MEKYKCIRCRKVYEEDELQEEVGSPYIYIEIVGYGFIDNKAGICPNCKEELGKWLTDGLSKDEWKIVPDVDVEKFVWNLNSAPMNRYIELFKRGIGETK